MQSILLCVSIGAALLLSSSFSQSEANDRSIIDILVSFSAAAAALYLLSRFYPALFRTDQNETDHLDQLPLDDLRSAVQKEQTSLNSTRSVYRKQYALIVVAISCLVVRIELYRKISFTAQCTSRSLAGFVPLILAGNEIRYQSRSRLQAGDEQNSDPSSSARTIWSTLLRQTWRYIPSACILAYGYYSVAGLWTAQTSTFICPIASGHSWFIPRLQQLSLFLDCLVAILVEEIARFIKASRQRSSSLPFCCALILVGTVVVWTTYATILYFADRQSMEWFLISDTPSNYQQIWTMTGRGLLFGIVVTMLTSCVSKYGVYHLSVLFTSSIIILMALKSLWASTHPFPPARTVVSIYSFFVLYFGAWSSYRVAQGVGHVSSSRTPLRQMFLSFSLFTVIFLGLQSKTGVHFHPIELLIYEARVQHENYVLDIGKSTNLRSAAAIYRSRYNDEPPPGFDIWYEYARSRSTLVMDEYDQIHRDLLPLRTIPPAELRKQTWEMVSNPWNEIAGISIRNGKAEVLANVPGTHRWMLDGIAVFINKFAQHLPDMDLAFNLNDESRVAVPYRKLNSIKRQAAQIRLSGRSSWSLERNSTWTPVTTEEYDKTAFENYSFQRNFGRFGSIGCAPNTLAVTDAHLSSQSHLCLKCIEPHSIGQFVSNWTLAADMCHQPDMSHLHGFYLSPAAFKTTHELMPVFSQSKASGYNDILYPSSWNYMDKVVYQPSNASGEYGTENYSPGFPDLSFVEKENILYWRGATSEGVSGGNHVWRGMTRQRLVHLINNATSTSTHDRTTILLAGPDKRDEFTYHNLPGTGLISLGLQQKTDIRIVDHIGRCGGQDCTDQEQEFGLVKPVDFQAHWRYRFLFDLDGAAFSGRFLPFLQSRSLPFKTALFREWYDSRITAWRHFVPIDLRLHGVWSTLAYFAGVDGVWPGTGKTYKWEAHTAQAELIAEEGRKWAGQVLRKEDMEVYFFRLLLEWGRLTDDRRDELGFSMP